MPTIQYNATAYQVGGDPRFQAQPLPTFLPTRLPSGWQEVDTSAWTERPGLQYARAYRKHTTVLVLVSCATYADGKVWLHISVSRSNKDIPSWQLMSEVKELFCGPDRRAIQVHVPRSKHINIHPGVLHLWACLDDDGLPDFTAGGDTI